METLLIILALGAVVGGVIVWISRKKTDRPFEQRLEQDTAWNDPVQSEHPPAVEPVASDSIDPDRDGAPRP